MQDQARLTFRLVLGATLALAGLLFTLDNLGIVEAEHFFRYWPALLVAFGAVQLAQAQHGPRRVMGAFWMIVGGVLLLDAIDLLRFSVRELFPLGLVALGGYIVWQTFQSRELRAAPGEPPGARGDPSAVASAVAVMSGVKVVSNSKSFRGGELTAIMGGCHVDLREAMLAGREATIDIFAIMGGIEMRVPETWNVIINVTPFMGGYEDRTRRPVDPAAPRLLLRGFVMMGGIDIRN